VVDKLYPEVDKVFIKFQRWVNRLASLQSWLTLEITWFLILTNTDWTEGGIFIGVDSIGAIANCDSSSSDEEDNNATAEVDTLARKIISSIT